MNENMTHMTHMTHMEADEISLSELVEQVRQGWRQVLGAVLLCLAGAGAAIMVIPTTYEASALVKVGQVGQVGQVEAPAEAVERMKTTAFVQEFEQQTKADKKMLVVAQPRGSALLQVQARGPSKEEAVRRVDAAVGLLVARHDAMAQPRITQLRADLAEFQKKLTLAESELQALDKVLSPGAGVQGRVEQSSLALLTSLRIQKAAEAIALREAVNVREAGLLPPATQPTMPIEAVVATDKPVAPRKALLLALGGVGGVVLGLMWVFIANGLRRATQGGVVDAGVVR